MCRSEPRSTRASGSSTRSRPGASGPGYFAPAVYADFHDIEYSAIREAAAVIDTSPLYKYVVSRPRRRPAARPGHHARRLERSQVDQVYLHALVRRGRQGRRRRHRHPARADQDTAITAADPCYRWFLLNATGLDAEVEDVSDARRRSPCRASSAARCSRPPRGQDWADVRYFRHRRTRDRRRRGERHPHRLHRRPRLRALDPGRRRARGLGPRSSRRAPTTGSSRRASAPSTSRASRPA